MPRLRSIAPIDEAKYWQYPAWLTVRKWTIGHSPSGTVGGARVYAKNRGLRRCDSIALAASYAFVVPAVHSFASRVITSAPPVSSRWKFVYSRRNGGYFVPACRS